MSKVTTKWVADDAINSAKIDWGTSSNQVCAELLPIKDAGGYVSATDVEAAIQEICAKYIANWDLVSSFSASGGYDDIDTSVKAAAATDTARTSFTAGKGVFVDASGDYTGGTALPSTGAQVTELGKAGFVSIRNSATKDPIDDGAGNEVYGILFYGSDDSKYYVKYFSDPSDVQTAYSFGSSTAIDLYFSEIYSLIDMPAEGFCRGGILGAVDVVAGDITSVTAGSGLTGGGTSGAVTLDVGAGDGIDVTSDAIAVDVTDFIDTTKGLTENSNDIQINLTTSGGLDFNGVGGSLEVDVTDFIDTTKGLTESSNDIQVNITANTGLEFNGSTGAMEVDTTDIIDTSYGLTEATNKARVNLDAAGGLDFNTGAIRIKADGIKDSMVDWGTGAGQISAGDVPLADTNNYWTVDDVESAMDEIGAVGITAGDGIDTSGTIAGANLSVSVDVTDVIDITKGLTENSNNIQVNITANEGLDFNGSTGALEVDVTDFIDTSFGLTEASNNIRVNLDAEASLDFNAGALRVKADGIKDSHIDWGTGAGQVSAGDVPLLDAGDYYTTNDVESALQQLGGLVGGATDIRITVLTLTSDDITAGYKAVGTKARGAAGAKDFVQLIPVGGPTQLYSTDFTAMNNDGNTDLIIIWKTSGAVTGIASPSYPSTGLAAVLEAGDKLQVIYQ